ncbi:MAG: AbrB/MazE/SpoVT family DNA-binding domain-containing protein [Candidatus Pacebacteria bacterium]|jgi:antitoxin component of MazEF toxin-antitoxin module|nr:AbrB/MazE/SpoVT family DNA-binding domain-containing protein [Candidatus Paceibacterota bacterium]
MSRKTSENSTRKLLRLGKTSLAVTLPKNILLELGWRETQKVSVKLKGKTIVIEDWKE